MKKPECLLGLLVLLLVTIVSACGSGDGTSSPVVTPCNNQVSFPDSNLETAIREAIEKPFGDICQSDLEKLTAFNANYANITDITGLEHCINLENLSLLGNQISDTFPLANLTNLTLLMIGENQIKDLSSISELTNLISLAMPSNEISDISQLSQLTNLEVLWIMNNQISDITPLANFTNLNTLFLGDNQISDLSPLSGLPNLTAIEIKNNEIADIAPLVENGDLAEEDIVDLQGNPLSETSENVYVPQLEERGVMVFWGPLPESNS
ncbi:MAG: leucine-rich repeat domain-containing protein [Chloroflexi bacterium]|nr:leucine-rich repeat domain-containing protein [Chloroflexota bacterium]